MDFHQLFIVAVTAVGITLAAALFYSTIKNEDATDSLEHPRLVLISSHH